MNARPDLKALTSVRGIAAWMVVLYHIRLSIAGLPEGVTWFLSKGYLAVDFFFLLSGFVIWLNYHERVRGGGWRAVPCFLKRRIARIWPLHLFILGCGVLLALVLAATGRHDPDEYPFAELPLHILLIQNWGLTDALSWNDPAWSISTELFAYLCFPLIVFAVDWRRVPGVAVVAAIAALFVLLAAVMIAGGARDLGDEIWRFGLLRCVVGFTAGTAIAALWLRWRGNMAAAAASAGFAILLLASFVTGNLDEFLAIPPAFGALLLALALTAEHAGNPLGGRALHYLGEVSYATYLGHFLLWQAFKLAFVTDIWAVPPALIALYLAMVLASSILLHHLVERPAQRWVNRLEWPRRRRSAATG